MRNFLSLLIFLLSNTAHAQSLLWGKQISDLGSSNIYVENENGYVLRPQHDKAGNIYTVGYHTGATDFDPGPGTSIVTSAVEREPYIEKFDAEGNLIWVKTLHPSIILFTRDYVIDDSCNLYISGTFTGTCDFDPNAGVYNLTTVSTTNTFILKLDSAGNFVWAKSLSHDNNFVRDIKSDPSGNLYLTGTFMGGVDFDPGNNLFYLTASGVDIFVLKLNRNGELVWAISNDDMGSNSISIDVDNEGSCYVASTDSYLFKLDSVGNLAWTKVFDADVNVTRIIVSGSDLLVTGHFEGIRYFDPGFPSHSLKATGLQDIFVLKLDLSGNFVWAKKIGGSNKENAMHMIADDSGNIYVAGNFQGTCDFNPSLKEYLLSTSHANNFDIFICKLNSSGDILSACQLGNAVIDRPGGIGFAQDGNILLTGMFRFTMDMDPWKEIYNFTCSPDKTSGYLLKLPSSLGVVDIPDSGNSEIIIPHPAVIYPNPTSGSITILSPTTVWRIKVTDVTGKTVYTIQCSSTSNTIELNVSPGVYYVTVVSDSGSRVEKIVVTN